MLRNLWDYLTTPCPKAFRRMGYVKESIAMASQHRHLRKQWQPHLAQCKRMIKDAAAHCTVHNHVVVLGGGIVNDIPLRLLAQIFKQVTLVDVVFTKETHDAARPFDNVELFQSDVTGVIAPSYRTPKAPLTPPKTGPSLARTLRRSSLVISANMWSHLARLPKQHVAPYHSDAAISAWESAIFRHHLALLAQIPGEVCFISDYERVAHIPLPAWQHQWLWQVDPALDKSPPISHRVGVCQKQEIIACLSPSTESAIATKSKEPCAV